MLLPFLSLVASCDKQEEEKSTEAASVPPSAASAADETATSPSSEAAAQNSSPSATEPLDKTTLEVELPPPPKAVLDKNKTKPVEKESDYLFDGVDLHVYAHTDPLGTWAMYGSDGMGAGVSSEQFDAGLKKSWYFLYNKTKVEVVDKKTQYPSVIGIRVRAGEKMEDSSGNVFEAEGKTKLFVWRGHLVPGGKVAPSSPFPDPPTGAAAEAAVSRARDQLTDMLRKEVPDAKVNWLTYESEFQETQLYVAVQYSIVNAYGARVQHIYRTWWDFAATSLIAKDDIVLNFRK
jgi:hypothetical protein